ncbi:MULTISPECIES: tRNA (N6-threonylcarbamoyladenosine(37)-N6)-methyltransferase TrmO [unclassified Meiothermus]|uniref:tRNA (N6-threonylcarbamoyladenosine(37)-N6)-methyltransferase TrmO n=1 Tax=unclassified Meiothermus TaxID=370471 RepID=UPI000D7CA235|nr:MULTISPECIES: tRNA (N6-threonylcarbamoyladenosine(37)-N6)-methyltransferase TrmO [unclassified Meiothermus]PZA06470.1 tRNA (N6-threonylcarbamoyladenosine(37)-N6)-methyltransferase TrmO [Meiothermus sp. Pnk-1]RYM36263.1 tRNA (N6-threonylcarbamoyladenosine(37)-N6)-methyltransferase TrmO [Meiothermus sp. PNK-Is4]
MRGTVLYTPIGVVRSPFSEEAGMPIQSVAAPGVRGQVEVFEEFAAGLQDLEEFSHLILLCHLHRIRQGSLRVVPFLDTRPHGVFATRSPKRPNPIGLTIVRLERLEGRVLHILEHDLLDGTPVLDIKPYVPLFDVRHTEQIGWFRDRLYELDKVRSDERFK